MPLYVKIEYSTDNVTYTTLTERYLEWTSNTTAFNFTDVDNGYYKVSCSKTDTLVLDQDDGTAGVGATLSIGTVTTSATPAGFAAKETYIILE